MTNDKIRFGDPHEMAFFSHLAKPEDVYIESDDSLHQIENINIPVPSKQSPENHPIKYEAAKLAQEQPPTQLPLHKKTLDLLDININRKVS